MNRIAILWSLILTCSISQAQIKWSPKWQSGQSENLEYTYSKTTKAGDTIAEFDSTHALIMSRYIGEFAGAHFMQWQFTNYYIDTTKGEQKSSNKMMGEIFRQTLERCPVKFTIDKSSFDIQFVNKKQIDSVCDQVSGEILQKTPTAASGEDKEMMKAMMGMVIGLRKDEAIYKVISDYYKIYTLTDLIPNQKKDLLSGAGKQGADQLNGLMKNADGYSMLEDSDPAMYKWKFEAKLDMGKMLNAFAETLTKAMEDADKEKKGKKSKKEVKKEEPKKEVEKSEAISTSEIHIAKKDMLVQSYYEYSNMDNLMGLKMGEIEWKRITKLK
jgi:hypothetical protein